MASVKKVTKVFYQERKLNFHCVIDDRGVPIFAPSMFLLSLAKKARPPTSIKSYASDLSSFFNTIERNVSTNSVKNRLFNDYRKITDHMMNGYLYGHLKQEKKLADSTVERHISTLKSFYTFCFDHGLLEKMPAFSYQYFENSSSQSIMDGFKAKLHKEYMNEDTFKTRILVEVTQKNPFIKERNELALKLGYYAGFRTHELVLPDNLQIKALKKLLPKQESTIFKSIKLPVKGKGRKLRIVRIEVPLVQALYKFLWGRAKHITTSLMSSPKGVPLKDINYGTALFKLCINNFLAKSKENIDWSREDFEIWDQKTYHQLRACFATNAVKLCRDLKLDVRTYVTQWMGHNEFSTTEMYIFYDAILNDLPDIIAGLSLVNTTFGKRYKAGKGINEH